MKQRPNLLFVFADQWRRMAMGCAGQDPVQTPYMDAFAATGVRCTAAVSSCPLCSPHRASLLTGRQPLHTGVFTNCKTGLSARLQDEEITLGELLQNAGYDTGYIGKWHLDEPEQNHSAHPFSGAEGWDAYTPQGPRRHGFATWYSYGACDDHLHPHYWQNSPRAVQVDEWSPHHETDRAIEFIRRPRSTPFGMVLSWNPPHSPYDQLPARLRGLYDPAALPLRPNVCAENLHCHTGEVIGLSPEGLRRATADYYGAVSGLDEEFGRLLAALRESGMAENTCVVLSADHGDMMGSHGLMAKHVWYEESIGIPLVMAGPGLTPGQCGTVLGSADFLPTLLDWLNLPTPATVEGQSRFAEITAHAASGGEAYLCACPGRDVFLQAFQAEGRDPRAYGWRAVRTPRYTYVVEIGYAPCDHPLTRLLYDLSADPYQMAPLHLAAAADHPEAARLEARLINFLRQQKDGFIAHFEAENPQQQHPANG